MIGLRLSLDRWQSRHSHEVTIEGLHPCLDLFGLALEK